MNTNSHNPRVTCRVLIAGAGSLLLLPLYPVAAQDITATIGTLILDGGTLKSATGTTTSTSSQSVSGNLQIASDSFIDLRILENQAKEYLDENRSAAHLSWLPGFTK